MAQDANYRKHNDHSQNSSTYHKKDGTPIRAILKEEAADEIKEAQEEAPRQAPVTSIISASAAGFKPVNLGAEGGSEDFSEIPKS